MVISNKKRDNYGPRQDKEQISQQREQSPTTRNNDQSSTTSELYELPAIGVRTYVNQQSSSSGHYVWLATSLNNGTRLVQTVVVASIWVASSFI